MQVTKLTSPADTSVPAGHQLSEKQLYDEINYRRSEKLTKKMLAVGLITPDECDKILLCAYFSGYLVRIYLNRVRYRGNIVLRTEVRP